MSLTGSDLVKFQKISSSLALRHKNMNDISTTLNCSNCSKSLRPPVIQCVQNHLLCGKCSKWECAKKCAKCNEDLALYLSRMLGKIIKRVPLMCRYEYCKIMANWEDIKIHEKDCEHKDIGCIFERPACEWFGHPSSLISHIRKKHCKAKDSTDNGILVTIVFDRTLKNVIRLIDAFDKTFLVCVTHCPDKKSSKIYVQALNNDSDKSARFMVDVIFLTSKHSFTMTGSCKVNEFKHKKNFNYHVSVSDHSLKQKSGATFRVTVRYKISSPVTPEILESMKCPVCDKVMLGHIFQCSLGHSFCDNCMGKFQNCAICRATIGRLRNYSLENLIEKMYKACKFAKYGCLEMGGLEYIADHELTCNFKSRNCCICNIYVDVDQYEEHSKVSHRTQSTIDMHLYNAITESKFRKYLTTFKNIQFNCYLIVDLENQLLCYIMQSTESRENAKNYAYSLVICDEENNREISFTETCTSHVDSLSSVITSGRYIAIPLDIIATYLDDEGTLRYTMNLESLSELKVTPPRQGVAPAQQPQQQPQAQPQQQQQAQQPQAQPQPQQQLPQAQPQPQAQQPQVQPQPQAQQPQVQPQPQAQQPQVQPQPQAQQPQVQPQPQAQQPQAQPQPQAQQPQVQPQPHAQQPQAQPQAQQPQAQPQPQAQQPQAQPQPRAQQPQAQPQPQAQQPQVQPQPQAQQPQVQPQPQAQQPQVQPQPQAQQPQVQPQPQAQPPQAQPQQPAQPQQQQPPQQQEQRQEAHS